MILQTPEGDHLLDNIFSIHEKFEELLQKFAALLNFSGSDFWSCRKSKKEVSALKNVETLHREKGIHEIISHRCGSSISYKHEDML